MGASNCSHMVGSQASTAMTAPLFALVRSRNTDRVHLLIHETDRDPRHIYHWHRIRSNSLRALQDRIVRLRGAAAPEVARCSNWIAGASEKPVTKVNAVVHTD